MAKIIFENELEELAAELTKKYRVIVPVLENEGSPTGKVIFADYQKGQKLVFSYATTNLPPKEFLLPPKDVLYEFENGERNASKPQKTVIIGLSIEDLEGLQNLRTIFKKPITDQAYEEKAENTYLIGLDHYSPPKNIHFDLYLQKVKPETYAGFSKTVFGKKIIAGKLFEQHAIKVPKVTRKKDSLIWDQEMAEIIEHSKGHPVWEELAQICFGCGICSYVCPLCYCFETEDELDLPLGKKAKGRRCRSWDSCMLSHFAETSNHNFRPELTDRIYNWYYHKFVRMPREYGFPGCVDCRRCTIFCPAKINYRIVLERLKKDYHPRRKK